MKDATFQHSTPVRHACELYSILESVAISKPILFIYSDGGPDHRLTYVSTKLSLICLFLKLDLDYLCAGRTAPYHSWRNPVERIMAILNLGLQCVGLARSEMPNELEVELAKYNTLSDIRNHFEGREAVLHDSLSPVKVLLCKIFSRLKLHNETFSIFSSATTEELSEFWSVILCIDESLKENGVYRQDTIANHRKIMDFMAHCCQSSHYSFDILKCGESNCTICKPVRLPSNIFNKLHHIPHPVPGEDGHYLSFTRVFGSATTEEYRPSFKPSSKPKRSKRKLPYYASVHHVKNAKLMVQCAECKMWRLIFSKYKLNDAQRKNLQILLDNYEYSCGATLKDLCLPEEYCDVDVRDHDCHDVVEKLYYSAKFDPICVYCGKDEPYTDKNNYPQCHSCKDKPAVKKKT